MTAVLGSLLGGVTFGGICYNTEKVSAADAPKTWKDLLDPRWLRIGGFWYPRGGIPIDVFWQTNEPPKGVLIPEFGVQTYRGRG